MTVIGTILMCQPDKVMVVITLALKQSLLALGKIIKNGEEISRMQENLIQLGTEIDICLSNMFLVVMWSR